MAAEDPFEADLDGLFAGGAAFDDAEAFARAVERRLEVAAAPSPAVRSGLIGLAAGVGGLVALKSLLDGASLIADAALRLRDGFAAALPASAPAGLDPGLVWPLAGVALAAAAALFAAREA